MTRQPTTEELRALRAAHALLWPLTYGDFAGQLTKPFTNPNVYALPLLFLDLVHNWPGDEAIIAQVAQEKAAMREHLATLAPPPLPAPAKAARDAATAALLKELGL